MNICLDGSFLGALGGIGTYSWQLIRALGRQTTEPLSCLVNQPDQSIEQYRDFETTLGERTAPSPQLMLSRVRPRHWWVNAHLPGILHKTQPDVFHCLDSISLPLWSHPCRFVLTLHDLIPYTNPEFCRWRDSTYFSLVIGQVLRQADAIITPSHHTQQLVEERFPHTRGKTRTIYSGVDQEAFAPALQPEDVARELRETYGLASERFLFTVATFSPRRNLVRLVEAFEQLTVDYADTDTCLVVAGSRGWHDTPILQRMTKSPLRERIHLVGRLSQGDLVRMYQAARCFAFVSLAEGFGLPVLEAMACNTPVVCSETTALGEIGGKAALTIDPLDRDSIAAGLHRVLHDDQTRTDLSHRGLLHASGFCWDETARRTLSVYQSLA